MTKLSIDEVTRIAILARLGLSDKELGELGLQLSSILDFVDMLQSIDTSETEITTQVTGLTNVLRDDVVKRCPLTRDELLKNTPAVESGHIKVKRVLG